MIMQTMDHFLCTTVIATILAFVLMEKLFILFKISVMSRQIGRYERCKNGAFCKQNHLTHPKQNCACPTCVPPIPMGGCLVDRTTLAEAKTNVKDDEDADDTYDDAEDTMAQTSRTLADTVDTLADTVDTLADTANTLTDTVDTIVSDVNNMTETVDTSANSINVSEYQQYQDATAEDEGEFDLLEEGEWEGEGEGEGWMDKGDCDTNPESSLEEQEQEVRGVPCESGGGG